MKSLTVVILCVLAVAAFAQTGTQQPASSSTTTTAPTPTPTPTPDAGNKSTTSTPGTTTTQAPGPSTTTATPAPVAGKWNVTTGVNVCLVAALGAQFSVNFTDEAGKPVTHVLNLPDNDTLTTASGDCGSNPDNATAQNIKLTFGSGCSMTLNFVKKDKSKFAVNKIDVNLPADCFEDPKPKAAITGSVDEKSLFQATIGQSYLCNSEQNVNVNSSINSLSVNFVDVQVQAFVTKTKVEDFKFGDAVECPQDVETSNIVPIAVGAALAALVLIVLIAYLISRNRGQRGYESV